MLLPFRVQFVELRLRDEAGLPLCPDEASASSFSKPPIFNSLLLVEVVQVLWFTNRGLRFLWLGRCRVPISRVPRTENSGSRDGSIL